jgi:hypothetical protein
MTDVDPRYLRRDQAAEYIKVTWSQPCSRSLLAQLAMSGGGPLFRLAGRFPVYTEKDLDDWARGRISEPRRSTSDIHGSPPLERAVA